MNWLQLILLTLLIVAVIIFSLWQILKHDWRERKKEMDNPNYFTDPNE